MLPRRASLEEFPDGPIVKQPVSQLPWGHTIRLLQSFKDPYLFDCLGMRIASVEEIEAELSNDLLDEAVET